MVDDIASTLRNIKGFIASPAGETRRPVVRQNSIGLRIQ